MAKKRTKPEQLKWQKEYDKQWKSYIDKLEKKKERLEKRRYVVDKDYIPDKPKQRQPSSLQKLKERADPKNYEKVTYRNDEGKVYKGEQAKKARESELKRTREQRKEEAKGEYVVGPEGTIVDVTTGNTPKYIRYEKDIGFVDKITGKIIQPDYNTYGDYTEYEDEQPITVDPLANILDDINELFKQISEEIGSIPTYAYGYGKFRDYSEDIQSVIDAINDKFDRIKTAEDGLNYYEYLQANVEKIKRLVEDTIYNLSDSVIVRSNLNMIASIILGSPQALSEDYEPGTEYDQIYGD